MSVASHELTLSSSCLITADRIDTFSVLMIFSVASYNIISSDFLSRDDMKVLRYKSKSWSVHGVMHDRQNALTDMP